jgi:hypothetical protein
VPGSDDASGKIVPNSKFQISSIDSKKSDISVQVKLMTNDFFLFSKINKGRKICP